MSEITPLTRDNFASTALDHKGVYVIRFWATWCGPCTMMHPIYRSVAEEMTPRAGFGEVDIDAAPELADAFGIRGVPTVMVLRDGHPVDQMVGVAPKGSYIAAIERQLAA